MQTTQVENISSGLTTIVLTYSSGSCFDYTSDTVVINNLVDIEAVNDSLQVNIEIAQAIDLLVNDDFDAAINVEILQEPSEGTYEIINGFITYTPDPGSTGEVIIEYEICYVDCPTICDQGLLVININQSDDCIVPSIFTPNGDGVNDRVIIPCFSGGAFPENEVRIFNQWGDEVFFASPYNNDWTGTYNGNDLPVGTYFTIVDRGDNTTPINGFIHLER